MKKRNIFHLTSYASVKQYFDFKIKLGNVKKEFLLKMNLQSGKKEKKKFKITPFVKNIFSFPYKTKTWNKDIYPAIIQGNSFHYYLTITNIKEKFIIENIENVYRLFKYFVEYINTTEDKYIEPSLFNVFQIIKIYEESLTRVEDLHIFSQMDPEDIITKEIEQHINYWGGENGR